MINPRILHWRFNNAFEFTITLLNKLRALVRFLVTTKDVNRDSNLNPSIVVTNEVRISDTVLG